MGRVLDRFSLTPLAAASIGQATLLRMSGILRNRMAVAPIDTRAQASAAE